LIALECTVSKVLKSIIIDTTLYLTEVYELLLTIHFGERPGRIIEVTIMLLIENIHLAWREKKVYSTVFIDVS
jgi:hypothetical protein